MWPAFWRTLKREWTPILAIACTWLIVFHPALTNEQVFFYRDLLHNYLPMKRLEVQALLHGEIPWWNPHQFGGVPFSADILSAVYYPLNLLLFLPSFYLGFNLYLVLHYLIAAGGVYFLTRIFDARQPGALVASLGFAFGCLMVWTSNGMQWLSAYSWIPWTLGAFALFLKLDSWRWLGMSAVCLAMQLLAGEPQSAYVTCVICAAMALGFPKTRARGTIRNLGGVVTIACLACGCTAIVLIPALELTQLTDRSEFVDLAGSMVWSFHPIRLFELLFSFPFGNVYPESSFWGGFTANGYPFPYNLSIYFGVVTVVFAGWGIVEGRGLHRWLPLSGLALSFAVALGKFFFVQPFLYRVAPLWKLFRYPERLMVFFVLFGCWLAAEGVTAFLNEKPRLPWFLYVGCAGLITGAIALVAKLWSAPLHHWLGSMVGRAIRPDGISALAESAWMSFVLVGALLVLSVAWFMKPQGVVAWLIPLLVAADVSVASAQLIWLIPTDFLVEAPSIRGLVSSEERPRVYWDPELIRARFTSSPGVNYQFQVRAFQKATLKPNLGLLYGFDYWTAYSSAKLKNFEKLHLRLKLDDVLNWWNVQVVAAPANSKERRFTLTPERKLLESVGTAGLYWNGDAYPRDWIVHQAELLSNEEAMFERLAQSANLRDVTLLLGSEGSSDGSPTEPSLAAKESVEALRTFNSVRYRATLLSDGYLVSSDAYYPGWSAKVDGHPARLLPANVQMRALFVKAGTHDIELRYVPTGFAAATGLTAIGWLIVLILVADLPGLVRRRRAHAKAATKSV